MSGETLFFVDKLLGHRRHRATAGYTHLADAHLIETAERVDGIIARRRTVPTSEASIFASVPTQSVGSSRKPVRFKQQSPSSIIGTSNL